MIGVTIVGVLRVIGDGRRKGRSGHHHRQQASQRKRTDYVLSMSEEQAPGPLLENPCPFSGFRALN